MDREGLAVTEAERRLNVRCWFWNPFFSARGVRVVEPPVTRSRA